jgi:cardiolipin synthase
MGRKLRLAAFAAVAALSIASAGCTLTRVVFGRDKRDVYHFRPSFGIDSPAFRRSLDTFGNSMTPGNRVTFLVNGDEIFPAMTRAIREAKLSVDLESYVFDEGRAGNLFADALCAAARRGVPVRVLVDAVGSSLGALKPRMEAAGVKVEVYRPIRLRTIYRLGKRTHRKILVVDGRICFTGGLGISDEWLGDARDTHEWRDTQVRAEGPVAAQMQAIFAEDWAYTTGEILAGNRFYPKIVPEGSVLGQAIKSSRGDSDSMSKMFYFLAIQSARRQILIQNAYFVPDKQVRDALIAAVRRGVDVEVMVPGRHIDLPYVRLASRHHYGEMLEAGVKIYEYAPTMMHCKTMVADDIYATIGSINFDARSMRANQEESLAFYDKDVAARLEAIFRRDLERCRRVTYESWDHRGFLVRLSELVFWMWEPYY